MAVLCTMFGLQMILSLIVTSIVLAHMAECADPEENLDAVSAINGRLLCCELHASQISLVVFLI